MRFYVPLLLGNFDRGGKRRGGGGSGGGETCRGGVVGALDSDTDQRSRRGQRWRNVVSIIARRYRFVTYMLIINYPFRDVS